PDRERHARRLHPRRRPPRSGRGHRDESAIVDRRLLRRSFRQRHEQDLRHPARTDLRGLTMKVNKTAMRAVFAVLALTYVLTHFLGHAHAQSSLGIGASEATLPSAGLFAGALNWINAQQQSFYRALSGAMRGMRDGDG